MLKDTREMKDKGVASVKATHKRMLEKVEEKVEEKVKELQIGLTEVRSRTRKFDTSVTPNSIKWWRYRHEYSFVESGILLCLIPIAMFYKYLWLIFRERQKAAANREHVVGHLKDIEASHLAWLQSA